MKQYLENEKQAVSYLQGEMSEAERDYFEERLFTDEDLSLTLDEAENDLIDEYLRGELDTLQKRKFENNYLISERRRAKLRASRVLQKELFPQKALTDEPISWWQKIKANFALPRLVLAGGLAAVGLFVLISALWFTLQNGNQQIAKSDNENQNISNELANQLSVNRNLPNSNLLTNEEVKPTNADNKTQTDLNIPQNSNRKPVNVEEKPKIAPPPSTQKKQIFAFTLLPPLRSSENPVLVISPDTKTIRLRVVHNNAQEFINYRAEIRASDGDLIWSREISVNSKNLSEPITLDVRSGALDSGTYELTLSGATSDGQLEEINFYNFVVQKSKKE